MLQRLERIVWVPVKQVIFRIDRVQRKILGARDISA